MTLQDIDRTFVISLPNSERIAQTERELNDNGISITIWSGIKKDDGAEGLRLAFKELFYFCLEVGQYDNVVVFEDDADLFSDLFQANILKVLNDLPKDYHILKLGANLLCPVEKVTDNLNKIRMSYALHAAMYSREAMQLILKHIDESEPIDLIIAKRVEPLGKCYVSSKMLATQRPTKSGIFTYDAAKHSNFQFYDKETGIVRWDKLMQQQWDNNTKHLHG
jgi:hypothetical protein